MARLDPDTEAAVVAAIRADDGRSRAQIARDCGLGSPQTVQRIADRHGIATSWDTTKTRVATAASRDHLKQRRAKLAARAIDEAEALLDRFRRPFTVVSAFGKEVTLPSPPPAELRNLTVSFGILIDKHVVLDRHDADTGADDAASMLGKLAAGLDAAAVRLGARPAPTLDELDRVDDPGESGAGDD